MYSFDSRIRYSETDGEEYITLPGIIDYFQDVACFHSEDIGYGGKTMLAAGHAWMLCSWQLEIYEYPQFGKKVTVGTIPYEFKSFTGCRNCFMKAEDGRYLVKANSIWAFMDMKAGRPVRVPEEMIPAYQTGEKFEMNYKPRRILLPEKGEVLEPVLADSSRLDLLGHVNNGQFVKIMYGLSKRQKRAGNVRVEYKTQAHAGDVLIPVRYEKDGAEIIALKSPEDTVYATLELSD